MTWLGGENARRLGRVLLACACLVLLARETSVDELSPFLSNLSWPWVAGAMVASIPAYIAQAIRWRVVATRLGLPLSFPLALQECYGASLLNLVLPGGIVGDAVRAGKSVLRHPQEKTKAALSVVIERLSGQLMLWSLIAATLPLWRAQSTSQTVQCTLLAMLPVMLFLLVLRTRALWTRLGVPRLTRVLDELERTQIAGGTWRVHALTSALLLGSCLAMYYCAQRAVAPSLSERDFLRVAPLVVASGSVPAAFLGLGPREAASAAAFAAMNLNASLGTSISLVFGLTMLMSTLPGLLFLAGARQEQRKDSSA